MSKSVEDLTAGDIEAFRAARQNACESDHPLVDEFRDSDEYKLDLKDENGYDDFDSIDLSIRPGFLEAYFSADE